MGWDITAFVEQCHPHDTNRGWNYRCRLVIHRNYILFRILGGISNPARTDPVLEPIVPPRGLPSDATPKVAEAAAYSGPDGVSHSWLLLEEILNYDWDRVVREFGAIRLQNPGARERYERQPRTGPPPRSAVVGAGSPKEEYPNISWDEPIREKVRPFLDAVIPYAKYVCSYTREVNPADVRLVFWFWF